MKHRLVHQLPPTKDNPRNSEGAFLRGKSGEILFAYSRYNGDSGQDHASCDIAMIRSFDEGESWSAPVIIAQAAEFGTKNIMSVSALEQQSGELGFYFLIKENDLTTTIGRTVSADGVNWKSERCTCNFPKGFYVINNDRIVRLSNNRLIAPAAVCSAEEIQRKGFLMSVTALVSQDDGKTFSRVPWTFSLPNPAPWCYRGYEEPGIIEYEDRIYYWMRTCLGRQYETVSTKGICDFFEPRPSEFTSPDSPMQLKQFDGVTYAIYNPIPKYDGHIEQKGSWFRTPFVLRKSIDGGNSWGVLNIIEDESTRGYCYPAIFKTNDNALLLGYCRGSGEDGTTLCRLGIAKIEIASID